MDRMVFGSADDKRIVMDMLKKDYQAFLEFGSVYRIKIAALALYLLEKTEDMSQLLDKNETEIFVRRNIMDLDKDQLLDVVKMLHVVTKEVYENDRRDPELLKSVEKRMKDLPKLEFISGL